MAKTRSSDQQYQKLQSTGAFICCQGRSGQLGCAFISYFQQQSSSSLDLLKLWYQFINNGAGTFYFVFGLSLLAYKNVEAKGGEKSISEICSLHFYHPNINYSCIIILNMSKNGFYIPPSIPIDGQFTQLFNKACNCLKIDRPYIVQPEKFKGKTSEFIYTNDIKTFFKKTPQKMAIFNNLLEILRKILFDCGLIEDKNATLEQIIASAPSVKHMIQESFRLEIFRSYLRRIQELDKDKLIKYQTNLKSQKILDEKDKLLLLEIANLKKEPKDLNKLKKIEMENAIHLQSNRRIVDILAEIKAKGVSQKSIENAYLISDQGLCHQLVLFLQFLQNYYINLSRPESPFLKVISLLNQDRPISDIKKCMESLPKTQSAILKPLVQKMTKNQKPSSPSFQLDKFASSQNKLKAKIEELNQNLQLAESQNERLKLQLEDQKSGYDRKIKSEEAKSKSIEQKCLRQLKKMSQQLEKYKKTQKDLQNENIQLKNLHKKSQKTLNSRQSERDTARIVQENKDLRQKIRQVEDRLDRQVREKQQQIDRILREKNEISRKISYEPPKNGEYDPLLLQYKDQCEQFTLELDRQKDNHAKLQEFLTKLQRQLTKNENETISKLRANEKKARKNYSELESLNRAQIQEIKKLSAEISLEKEANRKAQELKAELNTLREQYNEMKENYTRMFAGDGQSYSVSQQQHLVRQKSRK